MTPEPVDVRTRAIHLQEGEYLVLRAWRWDAERLQKDAELDFDIKSSQGGVPPSEYSISTYAMALKADETVEQLIQRLASHVQTARSCRYMSLITQRELEAAGFTLKQYGPEHHFDVAVGVNPDSLAVESLAAAFGLDEKIRMPR